MGSDAIVMMLQAIIGVSVSLAFWSAQGLYARESENQKK